MPPASTILVVEDELIVAKDVQRSLEKIGYAVAAAVATGEEAVAKAGELRPDLVLMDIRLKGRMDGIEAAGLIRDRFDIPVVYLTAHTDEPTLQRAKLAEAYGYILKPFEGRELRAAIEVAIHKHRAEAARRRRPPRPEGAS